MSIKRTRLLFPLSIVVAALLNLPQSIEAQTWTALKNPMPFLCTNHGGDAPLLLTDGSVLVQDADCSDFWRLIPDATGSYVNGSWKRAASLPANYGPLYRSAAVLADGRVIIEGGEYNFGTAVWQPTGAIYDPVADSWTPVSPPSSFGGAAGSIGDAVSVVLGDGRYMQADCCAGLYSGRPEAALLNEKDLTWEATGNDKADSYDEEGWTLLPNGTVLTVDANNEADLSHSEIYDSVSGTWRSGGSTVVQLADTNADGSGSHEIGPQVLRPDGTVVAFGATRHNAIYDSLKGTWRAGPDFPVVGGSQLVAADAPAALLPNGNLLVAASPGVYKSPSYFFEFDGDRFKPAPGPATALYYPSYAYDMLVLPTGQIMLTSQSSDVEFYTPKGTFKEAWQPVISSTPTLLSRGESYEIRGRRFNGMSQASGYGDDYQNATNYPLVRIRNLETGHVLYSRTHGHSSMAVASQEISATHFDIPSDQEPGLSELEVVANGIASAPVRIRIR